MLSQIADMNFTDGVSHAYVKMRHSAFDLWLRKASDAVLLRQYHHACAGKLSRNKRGGIFGNSHRLPLRADIDSSTVADLPDAISPIPGIGQGGLET